VYHFIELNYSGLKLYGCLQIVCYVVCRTQLESSNTPEYLGRQRRAERLAQEIADRDRHYNEGEDSNITEEDKYSSVVRPDQPL